MAEGFAKNGAASGGELPEAASYRSPARWTPGSRVGWVSREA
jgi:hypothetical protein